MVINGEHYFRGEWGAGVGAGCFWLLGAGAAREPGAGTAWEKNQEPEQLKKLAGSGSSPRTKELIISPCQLNFLV